MAGRGVVGVVLGFLRRMKERGRDCVALVDVVAGARLSRGEVLEALRGLEEKGLVVVSENGGRTIVCYVGSAAPSASERLVEAVVSIARGLVREVSYVRVLAGVYPGVDLVVVRRDGVGFAVRIVSGRVPPVRLVREADLLARRSRRLYCEWREAVGKPRPRLLIPLIVLARHRLRVVEGVAVVGLDGVRRVLGGASELLGVPYLRVVSDCPSSMEGQRWQP